MLHRRPHEPICQRRLSQLRFPLSSYGKLTTELCHCRKAPTHHTLILASYLCTCFQGWNLGRACSPLPPPCDHCYTYSVISHPQMLAGSKDAFERPCFKILFTVFKNLPQQSQEGKVSATPLPWNAQNPPWPTLSIMVLAGPPLVV